MLGYGVLKERTQRVHVSFQVQLAAGRKAIAPAELFVYLSGNHSGSARIQYLRLPYAFANAKLGKVQDAFLIEISNNFHVPFPRVFIFLKMNKTHVCQTKSSVITPCV